MSESDNQSQRITCEEAQLLMVPMWANGWGVSDGGKATFEAHLAICPGCAQEYEETKRVMSLAKTHWGPISAETRKLLERSEQESQQQQPTAAPKAEMTTEEAWQDLLCRCPDLSQSVKRQKHTRFIRRVAVVAACLVLALSAWLVFLNHSQPGFPENAVPQRIAAVPQPAVKIEIASGINKTIVPANRQISTAADEHKTVIINDKHQMIMNANTLLSIEPLAQNNRVGCRVRLVSGEVFTHVEHDGNPFIVGTPHGQAVITGTTFDMRVTDSSTTLSVNEGTVRFESDKGSVSVTAGYISEVVADSYPTTPIGCDADELTAWATGCEHKPALTQSEPDLDFGYPLASFLRKKPIVLKDTDYDGWTEENRDWFKQQFPWIFQLKEALAKEGVEVDYPELLMKTGDVWQFICLETSPARFSMINPNSLCQAAADYGFDKQWLQNNAPIAMSATARFTSLDDSCVSQETFERWLQYVEGEVEPPTPFYSYDAGKYMANTRSLIWFAVTDGKYDLTDEERASVVVLLQEEVTAACECQQDALYSWETTKPSCDNACQAPCAGIIAYIEAIQAAEERIAEHEICK